jgi:hypothetical protein
VARAIAILQKIIKWQHGLLKKFKAPCKCTRWMLSTFSKLHADGPSLFCNKMIKAYFARPIEQQGNKANQIQAGQLAFAKKIAVVGIE